MHLKRDNHAKGALSRALSRFVGYFYARSMRYCAGLFAVMLGLIVLVAPSPYAVESAGPTQNVLGRSSDADIIAVEGADTYDDDGELLMVTVNASGVPGYPVSNIVALFGWISSKMVVMPSEAVFPIGQTAEEYAEESDEEMTSSQDAATVAALAFLESQGMDVSDIDVTMHVDDIGGPSAGMMYALGLIDKLTPQDETGGLTIAGTGTMDEDGNVGSIGGIRLKMLGAVRDGATWFLAPEANCDEVVGNVPDGLRDVSVSTLEEAYDALVAIGNGEGESLPHCAVE